MIERLWSGESGWWRLLLPLAWLYGAVSQLIAMCYRLGLKKNWRAPVPVVVVGNLTAGGNGKTPVVIWLVQALRRHGLNPAVVSRGYGGHAQHYPLIVDSSVSTEQAGDEPVLIAQRTGVPVAVAPKRADAVRLLLNRYPDIDLIITDDGLQHLALQRDIEIVVIDGVRRFGNGWWLPAGPMRELASRLRSVDAIITNGGQAEAGEIGMHLQPGDLVNLSTGETRALSGLPDVVAIAGIGHPARFFNTLQQAGIQPVKKIAFADHQAYRREELQALTREGQLLIMTEKDAVKCRAFAQDNWWYLPVNACLSAESGQLVDSIVMQCPAR